MNDWQVIQGDVLDGLAGIPDESVHTIVTSPPYWQMRNYNMAGQLGSEKTLAEYITNLVEVGRECRRVLRSDGLMFWNHADSYASGKGTCFNPGGGSASLKGHAQKKDAHVYPLDRGNVSDLRAMGFRPKDLIMQSALTALAFQADGWWLISEIIWAKGVSFCKTYAGSSMPFSGHGRPGMSHEKLFIFAKHAGKPLFWTHRDLPGTRVKPKPDHRWLDRLNNLTETNVEPANWRTEMLSDGETKRWLRRNLWRGRDYFYDRDAVKEPAVGGGPSDKSAHTFGAPGGKVAEVHKRKPLSGKPWNPKTMAAGGSNLVGHSGNMGADGTVYTTRNLRSVWTINPKASSLPHYAAFPPALVRPCVLSGSSEAGCCPECHAPYFRALSEAQGGTIGKSWHEHAGDEQKGNVKHGSNAGYQPGETIGWRPTCDCGRDEGLFSAGAGEPVPCTVLDPFSGTATTGVVALALGRRYIGIELKEEYVAMSRKRLADFERNLEAK